MIIKMGPESAEEMAAVVGVGAPSGPMAAVSVRVMSVGAVVDAGRVEDGGRVEVGALLDDDKGSAFGEDDAATAELADSPAGFVFSSLVVVGKVESKGEEVGIGSGRPAPPAVVFEPSRSVISMFLSGGEVEATVVEGFCVCVCVSSPAPVDCVEDAIGRLNIGNCRFMGLPPPIDRCVCNGF